MNGKKVFAVVVAAAALGVTFGGLALMVRNQRRTIDALTTQLNAAHLPMPDPDVPKEYKPVSVDHHYERLGQKIYLSDDTFGEIWLPVLADVSLAWQKQKRYTQLHTGRMVSKDEFGNRNALTGIDLSSHNVVTDWDAVKADGIDFVMLRAGYRGYGKETGTLNADEKFRQFYRGAKDAGLLVGAYFFSQAITEEEAIEEAILTAQQLEGCELDFPVAFDWELIFHDKNTRTENMPVDVLTNCALAFCQNIEAFGYQAMIYQNKRTSLFKLDLPRLQDYPFWLAEYGDGPTYPYHYEMWQYSCKGTVAGIDGAVDLNLCFQNFTLDGAPPYSLPASAADEPDPEPAETTAPPEEEEVPPADS